MRDKPLGIGRVSVEAKSNMIVDPAQAHGLQCLLDHLQGLGFSSSLPVSKKKQHVMGSREFRGLTESALHRVKAFSQLLIG